MKSEPQGRIIFVTGTDTGVGKTVLTGLLLAHLRRPGRRVLAMKPFCSGGLGDVNLLRALLDKELSASEMNPWFFPEPVAPLVAARKHRQSIPMAQVVARIQALARRCDCLLVEGAGGLLVPLGEESNGDGPYTTLDLIRTLRCETIVVARNKLGTISHTLLTVRALEGARGQAALSSGGRKSRRVICTVLMHSRKPDASSVTNARILSEMLAPVPLLQVPFLGGRCRAAGSLKKIAGRLARTLDTIAQPKSAVDR